MPIAVRKSFSLVGFALMIILLMLGFFAPNVGATVEFAQAYSFGAVDQGRSMCQAGDGGYVLVGQTQATSSSPNQALIVRVNSAGVMLWNKTYGGTNRSLLLAVTQTADLGFAVAGTLNVTSEKFWLFKVDPSGNLLWEHTYGGTYNEELYAMTQTSDGGYALTGWTTSFGSSSQPDLWIVKTDSNGIAQWNRTYGTGGNDCGYSIVQTSDGGYALAGQTNSNYCWLIKTDSNGNIQWNQTLGGTGSDVANSLVGTSDGGYAIAGTTDSYGPTRAFFLAKVDIYGPNPAPTFNLTTDSTSVTLGQSIKLTGTLSLPKSGSVTLDWSINSSGFVFHTNENLTNGVFSRSFGFGQTGPWQFRVNWPGDATSNPVTSNTVSVTVTSGVIPEFPSALLLSALLTIISALALMFRKESRKREHN